MDHYEDRFLLIPAFPTCQTSNPSWTPSSQDRSEEPEVGWGGGGGGG